MPSATRPAITRMRDARRSVAITLAPGQLLAAADDRGAAADLDVRAHAAELGHVHEAVLEDRLGDHALALRAASTMNCACMSVGKPGVRLGRDVDRREVAAAARRGCRPSRRSTVDAGRAQLGDHGLEVLEPRAAQEHVAAGDRGRRPRTCRPRCGRG